MGTYVLPFSWSPLAGIWEMKPSSPEAKMISKANSSDPGTQEVVLEVSWRRGADRGAVQVNSVTHLQGSTSHG